MKKAKHDWAAQTICIKLTIGRRNGNKAVVNLTNDSMFSLPHEALSCIKIFHFQWLLNKISTIPQESPWILSWIPGDLRTPGLTLVALPKFPAAILGLQNPGLSLNIKVVFPYFFYFLFF